MKLLKKYKSRIGSLLIFSLLLQVTSPLVAATQLPAHRAPKKDISPQQTVQQKASFADSSVNELIKHIVHEALTEEKDTGLVIEISPALKKCYKLIMQGKHELPAELLWHAMPALLSYTLELEKTKAARPTAQTAPVVGPGICDFTHVTEVLTSIKNIIGCVGDSVCCNTILGVLGDACNILDCSIACTLTTIIHDIIDSGSTIIEKINEIEDTLTTCCSNIINDLEDLSDQLEECCDEIRREIFNSETTILEALSELNTSQTICCAAINDALDDLSDDLEECCDNIRNDINIAETNIVNDLNNLEETLTACCSSILDEIDDITCEICPPTPLTQLDVVGGVIELTVPGNYKLCENVTADLVISNTGISVDLNDRTLNGTVSISGDDVVVKNGFIHQTNPPVMSRAPISNAVVSVFDNVWNVRLFNLTITSADQSTILPDNSGRSSSDGIYNNGLETLIIDCVIQTGAGANGGPAVPDDVTAGAGGNSGSGILSYGNKAQIIRALITTGNAGNGGATEFGDALGNAGNAGTSGTGIQIFGDLSNVTDCQVFTGNGGQGGASCCLANGNGGNSGDGIYNESRSAEITGCTVRTGDAGNGNSNILSLQGGNGGNSGNAIHTRGTQVVNNVLSTGNAGNGGSATVGGNGGNAGHGLFVEDACETEARDIVVERTGRGGNGGDSSNPGSAGGNGGNGGDAVQITHDSKHTEVRNSTFSNTGEGGLGGAGGTGGIPGFPGFPGRAVTDLNDDLCSLDPSCTTTLAPSAIFGNFAYGIADTNIRYLINGQGHESGKASNRSCNYLDNVFVECDVNETFDICAELAEVLETLTTCCQAIQETVTTCCDELGNAIADIAEAQAECCEEIINDIAETTSVIINALDQLVFTVENCDCDFFITQDTAGGKNHPVNEPITVPGIYCFVESVTGSIRIQSSNVTILMRGHTLTAPDGFTGINSSNSSHITIDGGIIQNGTAGISIDTGSDIRITNMTLTNNIAGLSLSLITDFVIDNVQFTQNSNTDLSIDASSNGSISNCIMQNSQNTTDIALISLTNSQQLSLDGLIITDNVLSQTLRCIETTELHESNFKNIQITNNQTVYTFNGILLRSSNDNSIANCTINQNVVEYIAPAVGRFYGIQMVRGSAIDASFCDNNSVLQCQINNNSVTPTTATSTTPVPDSTILYGIDIGKLESGIALMAGPSVAPCNNIVIDGCLINTNSNTSIIATDTQLNALTVGINIAGITGLEIIVADACANTTIKNCSINNNASSTHFTGIVLGGVTLGSDTNTIVGARVCRNAIINNCAINANTISSVSNPNLCFAGINVGSVLGGAGTVSADCCQNCSISNCTINNNILDNQATNENNPTFFMGVIMGSTASLSGEGQVRTRVAMGCSITNCSVNDNSYDPSGETSNVFAGFALGNIFSLNQDASIGTSTCSNCVLRNCSVNNNTNSDQTRLVFSIFSGFNLGCIAHFSDGPGGSTLDIGTSVCQNCSLEECTVNGNKNDLAIFSTGINLGSSLSATINGTISIDDGACDNCSLAQCTINDNVVTMTDVGATPVFTGVTLGTNMSFVGPFEGFSLSLTNASCNNFSLSDITINNNSVTILGSASVMNTFGFLVGVNIAASSQVIQRAGISCNNGVLNDVSFCNNSLHNTAPGGYLRGINMHGAESVGTDNVANNITATRCLIEGNSIFGGGSFAGFFVNGTGLASLPGHCDNLTLRDCEVNHNATGDSTSVDYGYNFVNTSGTNVGVQNLQLERCVAKQNNDASGFQMHGFAFEKTPNALVQECLSIANSGHGFQLIDVVDAFLQQCQSLENVSSGFSLEGDTNNVGIIDSQALGNGFGFVLAETTTLCHIRNNIAQDNLDTGFWNVEADEWKHQFINNYAQANVFTNYINVPMVVAPQDATNAFANISA